MLAGSSITWGAQDVSQHQSGAFTGEVSGSMLSDFGCRYVLVGHSERRAIFGDSDAIVAAKFEAARKAALLKKFGSVRRLQLATEEQISEVPGFGGKAAGELKSFLAARSAAPAGTA